MCSETTRRRGRLPYGGRRGRGKEEEEAHTWRSGGEKEGLRGREGAGIRGRPRTMRAASMRKMRERRRDLPQPRGAGRGGNRRASSALGGKPFYVVWLRGGLCICTRVPRQGTKPRRSLGHERKTVWGTGAAPRATTANSAMAPRLHRAAARACFWALWPSSLLRRRRALILRGAPSSRAASGVGICACC